MEETKNVQGCTLPEGMNRCVFFLAGMNDLCAGCGWGKKEFARRKKIKLTRGEDGLLRKVIRRDEE